MTLKLKPAHALQLHIKDEAGGAKHSIGPNKLFCRSEDLDIKAC